MFDSGTTPPTLETIDKRWWLIPLAVLAGAVSLVLWQVFLGDQSLFYRDLYRQHLGTARMLASGQLPFGLLWDPLLNGGQPLLANPNRFLLYPSRLLYLIMAPTGALNSEIALHLLLGGTGTIILARRLGLGRAACSVAGISFALGGLSISLTNHLGRLLAYHWFPWIVLATHIAFDGGKTTPRRLSVLVPVVLALQWLTGAAELAAMAAVIVVIWALVASGGSRRKTSVLVFALVAIGLGVILAAIQVVPSAEMVLRSERALGTPAEMSLTWSMHPLRIFEFAVPGFLGPVDVADPTTSFWGGRLVDFGFPYFLSLYFGAATLLLAVFGWIGSAHHPQWRRWRWGLLGIAAPAVIALGRYLPLIGEVLSSVPGLDLLRYPIKALLMAGLPVALMAGRGVEVLFGAERPLRRRLTVVAAVLSCVFAILSTAMATGLARPVVEAVFQDYAMLALRGLVVPFARTALVLAGVGIIVVAGSHFSRRSRAVMIVVLVAFDLIGAAAASLPLAPRETLTDPPPVMESIAHEIGGGRLFRDRDPASFVLPLAADRAWASAAWWQEILDGSLAANWGAPMVFHSDAEVIAGRRMAILAREAMAASWIDRVALLQIAGASLVMTPADPEVDGLSEVSSVRVPGGVVYRFFAVDGPQPFRWLPSQRMVSSEEEALGGLISSSFDPSLEVVREIDAPISRARGGTIARLTPRSELWRGPIAAPQDGFLVTAVPWHPDLAFEIDGEVVPAEQVNFAFAGAQISAGQHQVRLLFAPRSVVLGGMLTLLAAVALVVAALSGGQFGRRSVRFR